MYLTVKVLTGMPEQAGHCPPALIQWGQRGGAKLPFSKSVEYGTCRKKRNDRLLQFLSLLFSKVYQKRENIFSSRPTLVGGKFPCPRQPIRYSFRCESCCRKGVFSWSEMKRTKSNKTIMIIPNRWVLPSWAGREKSLLVIRWLFSTSSASASAKVVRGPYFSARPGPRAYFFVWSGPRALYSARMQLHILWATTSIQK